MTNNNTEVTLDKENKEIGIVLLKENYSLIVKIGKVLEPK